MPLVIVGILVIIAGALLISPAVRDTLWSRRGRGKDADVAALPRTAAFDDRLMSSAIMIALIGVVVAIIGLLLIQ